MCTSHTPRKTELISLKSVVEYVRDNDHLTGYYSVEDKLVHSAVSQRANVMLAKFKVNSTAAVKKKQKQKNSKYNLKVGLCLTAK